MTKKIIYYCILLGLLTVAVGLGVYNLVAATSYKNNELIFKVNNEDAFFEATGNYYYGDVADPTSVYAGAHYYQDDFYNGGGPSCPVWNIGTSEFIPDEVETLKYVVTIKNCNIERALKFDLKGVATHPEGHFVTKISYKNGSADDQVVFSNVSGNQVNMNIYDSTKNYVNVTNHQIASGETLQITIVLELITNVRGFTMDNNISFELSTVVA